MKILNKNALLIIVLLVWLPTQAQRDCAGRELGDLNLFPNIPEINTNPYWKTAFYRLDAGLKTPTKIPSNQFFIGEEIIQSAIATLHPQSNYAKKGAARNRLLLLLNHVFTNWETNGKLLGDFSVYHETALAYYMLLKADPNSIDNNKKNRWNKALVKSTDKILKERAVLWAKKKAEPLWYNADVRYALGAYVSGHLLKRSDYVNKSCDFYSYGMQQAILPDGGFNYVGAQNEVFTYHAVCVQSIAWFYLLTKHNYAKEVIKRTKNYYPLSVQSKVSESYTAVAWKHYWNRSDGAQAAYIIASVTNDGENYRIGKKGRHTLLPFFYKKGLTEKPDRNNFLVFDRNIQGPRGKYGNWAFAGSARDPFAGGKADNGLGKSTFVGAMVLENTSNTWPLNAAIDKVTIEFQKEKTNRDETELRLSHRFMAMDEKNATSILGSLAGLTTSYRVTDRIYGVTQDKGNKTPKTTNWFGNQQWVFTKERMIGQLEISPNTDEEQYAVNALIKLTSGRASWGIKHNFKSLGNNIYEFGNLRFKIHKNGLKGNVRGYVTDTYSPSKEKKGYNFIIQDAKSNSNRANKVIYKKGEKFNYIVEVYPKWQSPSSSVASNLGNNASLKSFQAKAKNSNVTLVHNISGDSQTLLLSALKKQYRTFAVLKSWDNNTQVLSNATTTYSIPANQHIIVIDDNRNGNSNPVVNNPAIPVSNSGQLIANGTYHIKSPSNNQNLLAPSWNKFNAQMNDAGNFSDQKWEFVHLGSNYYTIKNLGTQRFLEVSYGKCGNKNNVASWIDTAQIHQQWKIEKIGANYVFKPKHCETVALDRDGGGVNANVHTLEHRANYSNQHWKIAAVTTKSVPENLNILAYPNPTSEFVFVDGILENTSITIYNISGKLVKELIYKSEAIDVSALVSGIYFVKIGQFTVKFLKE